MKIIDLQNRNISNLGKEGTTDPIGGLDGVVEGITTSKMGPQ